MYIIENKSPLLVSLI